MMGTASMQWANGKNLDKIYESFNLKPHNAMILNKIHFEKRRVISLTEYNNERVAFL